MIPRPRVGDRIRANGKEGTVISVLSAREVLYGLGEVEAQVFGDNQKSMLGKDWVSQFYRVGVRTHGSAVEWFDCHDIEEKVGENESR